MPKMILHNFAHPLGQIVTAKYWHQVKKGKLHMVSADSGWAKFGWGKIYGQWLCGAVIVAYDVVKFDPAFQQFAIFVPVNAIFTALITAWNKRVLYLL